MSINSLSPLPSSLLDLKSRVQALYFTGNLSLLDSPKVAIIGSRRALSYTKDFVRSLASDVAKSGGVVVSGGAMGVDACAHEGAGVQHTIAVMPCSLDLTYPSTNRVLLQDIYAKGLALSEYPPSTRATLYSFVQRNRIIVALCDVVVVAEAEEKSGSAGTLALALAMGKQTFVLPHRATESLATNKALKEKRVSPLFDSQTLLDVLKLSAMPLKEDPFLTFCATFPSYDEAVRQFKEKVFEYELLGLITVENGKIRKN